MGKRQKQNKLIFNNQNSNNMNRSNILNLTKNGKSLCCGSDRIIYYDRRWNISSIRRHIKERNKRYSKNFPHLVCDGFQFENELKIYNL